MHPATVRHIEALSALLSMHRGIVDFIVTQVRGNVARGAAGLLDKPADTLLTADVIYEHFRDRIREDARFAEFDGVVRRDIRRAIDELFGDEPDRVLARRACDLLILNEFTLEAGPRTVADLVGELAAIVSETAPEANEQYLAEVLLEPLARASLFMRVVPAARAGDRAFRITLERDRRGLFEKELTRVLDGVAADDARIVPALMERVSCALPLAEVLRGVAPEVVVQWRGTARRGALMAAEAVKAGEAAHAFETQGFDFLILVAQPGFATAGEPYPAKALVWLPAWHDDERATLRRYFGITRLCEAPRGELETAVIEEARATADAEKGRIAKLLERGYHNGFFMCGATRLAPGARHGAAGVLEKLVETPVLEVLKKAHPRFLEVAPNVEFISRRTLAPLIDAIVSPGRIGMAAARKNNTRMMIEDVLMPMGLARIAGAAFVMQLDPVKSALVRETMAFIGGGTMRVDALMKHLREGAWGLSLELYELLIAALVRGGLAELRRGGRKIPVAVVGLKEVAGAEEIQAGEILSPALRDALFKDPFLAEGLDAETFSLASQRAVWEKLLAYRQRFLDTAEEVGAALATISEFPALDSFDFERVRRTLDHVLLALEVVKPSHGSSQGLAAYLTAPPTDLAGLAHDIESARLFAVEGADRVVRIADYLREVPQEHMPAEVRDAFDRVHGLCRDLTDVVFSRRIDELAQVFDVFRERYGAWYVEEHRRAFARERFAMIEEVRNTPAYRTLRLVDRIGGIHLVESASAVERRIEGNLAKRCARTASAELRLKSRCPCGFSPGEAVVIDDAASLMASVRAGIEEALCALMDGAVREKLIARVGALKDIEPNDAACLGGFLHSLRSSMTCERFVATLTPELARLIDDALHRKVKVIPRCVKSLTDKLSGRRLPQARIREMFDEWLGDVRGDDVLVDMGAGDAPPADTIDAQLAGWIQDHGFDDAGGDRFLCDRRGP